MAIVGTQIRDWGHRIIPIGGGRSRHYIVLYIDPPTSAELDVFVHEYSSKCCCLLQHNNVAIDNNSPGLQSKQAAYM